MGQLETVRRRKPAMALGNNFWRHRFLLRVGCALAAQQAARERPWRDELATYIRKPAHLFNEWY